jgi:hypothetical protein
VPGAAATVGATGLDAGVFRGMAGAGVTRGAAGVSTAGGGAGVSATGAVGASSAGTAATGGAGVSTAGGSFASLERLVGIAFRTIRIEDDHNRASGQVFSPDERDYAEKARSAAFNQLVETAGQATHDAILRLADNPDCPIPGTKLRKLARERAAQDSESARWLPAEVVAFEKTAETAPSKSKDLQRVALRRLDDMQHDLLHADFAQGSTVAALPD